MKKLFTYLGLVLAACLILVACASNKPAEKKGRTNTNRRAKADATVLIDTMLGKSSNGFSKLYGKITKVGLNRMSSRSRSQILLKRKAILLKLTIPLLY
ncbi:MAG: hypothetical protein ACLUBG_04290 [Streptococcus agalactiae]